MDADEAPNRGDEAPGIRDEEYYGAHYYACGLGLPYERNEIWLRQFRGVAARIVEDLSPGSVLDAGCAIGLLVECLVERGVDAEGVDISSYAIGQAYEPIRDRCRVGSILEPFGRRYDLIVSIEVLEHLRPHDAEAAVANLCAHSDDVLFSSTPHDFKEPSHFNVRPPDYWAGLFARHGFFRDLDHEATYLTPWAARFRKVKAPVPRIVSDYERLLWRISQENRGARESLVEYEGKLAALAGAEVAVRDHHRQMSERYSAEAALAAEFNRAVAAWSAHVQNQDATIRILHEELAKVHAIAEDAKRRAVAADERARASEAAERTIRSDKAETDSRIQAIQKSRAWKLASGLSSVRRRMSKGQ